MFELSLAVAIIYCIIGVFIVMATIPKWYLALNIDIALEDFRRLGREVPRWRIGLFLFVMLVLTWPDILFSSSDPDAPA